MPPRTPCTFSLIMCLKNLATNTLIPTGVATTARTRGTAFETGCMPLGRRARASRSNTLRSQRPYCARQKRTRRCADLRPAMRGRSRTGRRPIRGAWLDATPCRSRRRSLPVGNRFGLNENPAVRSGQPEMRFAPPAPARRAVFTPDQPRRSLGRVQHHTASRSGTRSGRPLSLRTAVRQPWHQVSPGVDRGHE